MVRSLKVPPRTREGVEALWNFFATSRRKKLWYRGLDRRSTIDIKIVVNHKSCRAHISALIKSDSLRRLSLDEIEIAAYSLMQGVSLWPSNVVETSGQSAPEAAECCPECDRPFPFSPLDIVSFENEASRQTYEGRAKFDFSKWGSSSPEEDDEEDAAFETM